jgi:hypothetical protein
MTDLKLSTATEATTPVEKVVEPVKVPVVPVVEVPPTHDNKNTVKPVDVLKTDEEVVAPAV